MKSTRKIPQQKITRLALRGAVLLGVIGFATGAFITLYFKLPIPPLFITELGFLLGGCLGALCALTETENRVFPSFVAMVLSIGAAYALGLSWSVGGLLVTGLSVMAWMNADEPKPNQCGEWKEI